MPESHLYCVPGTAVGVWKKSGYPNSERAVFHMGLRGHGISTEDVENDQLVRRFRSSSTLRLRAESLSQR